MSDHEGTLQLEYDDISIKAKPISTRFGGTFGSLTFGEKSVFNALLGFTLYLDYEPTNTFHVDSSAVYTTGKIIDFSTEK